MEQEALRLLKALTEAPGAPGAEGPVRRLLAEELGQPLWTDHTGSVVHEVRGSTAAPTVMLAAHLDEIALVVQSIAPDGYLKIMPLGGWWSHTLPSQRMRVITRSGAEILGVVAAKPVHHLGAAEKDHLIPVEELLVDVGAASAAEVKDFGIRLGDPLIPEVPFTRLHKPNLLLGKAFDDRAGVALLVQAGRALRQLPHANTVCCVDTVQEEVGIRGAQTAAALTKPDVALVLEGPPADDLPGSTATDWQGALGKGVQIRLLDPTAITNRVLAEFAEAVAVEEKIPCQLAVRRSGGTDARAIHLYDRGVPCVVLGVPVRYAHAHNGILDLNDYLATLRLVIALCQRLDAPRVANFTAYL